MKTFNFFFKMLLSGIVTVFIFPIGVILFFYFFIKEFLPKRKIKNTEKIIAHDNVIDIKTRKILH